MSFLIRSMRSRADFSACVGLQKETWGPDYSDVVPISMMQVTRKVGGVGLGAFLPDGEMIGFAYGVSGVREGSLVHWSHMTAVRPEWQNQGVGKALKLKQKDKLLGFGIRLMFWTYDPLVARNAHFNLNRLGVEIDEYVPDLYGPSDSPLHQLGTDRFIVRWRLDRKEPSPGTASGEVARIAVPADIDAVRAASAKRAAQWRSNTRRLFLELLGRGFRVCGFERGAERSEYLLVPGDPPASGGGASP